MSLSSIPRSVEDEEESVMGGLGLIFLLEAAEGGEVVTDFDNIKFSNNSATF